MLYHISTEKKKQEKEGKKIRPKCGIWSYETIQCGCDEKLIDRLQNGCAIAVNMNLLNALFDSKRFQYMKK